MGRRDRRFEKGGNLMPEQAYSVYETPVESDSANATICCHPRRPESLNIPAGHEERLEWVLKSCERFFEKVREFDALPVLPELN
jgi:hypothetical protein